MAVGTTALRRCRIRACAAASAVEAVEVVSPVAPDRVRSGRASARRRSSSTRQGAPAFRTVRAPDCHRPGAARPKAQLAKLAGEPSARKERGRLDRPWQRRGGLDETREWSAVGRSGRVGGCPRRTRPGRREPRVRRADLRGRPAARQLALVEPRLFRAVGSRGRGRRTVAAAPSPPKPVTVVRPTSTAACRCRRFPTGWRPRVPRSRPAAVRAAPAGSALRPLRPASTRRTSAALRPFRRTR